MKILLYGLNYSPELTGIGKYSGELGEWLAGCGHSVQVVTSPPYYPEWRIASGYSNRRYRHEEFNGTQVIRCPLWVPTKASGAKRIVHLLSFAISSIPALLWSVRLRPDVVIVVAPTLFCTVAGWLAARLVGAKCWLHIQDFEIDAAFDLGLLKGGLLRKLVLCTERWIFQRFDCLSTISDRMLERLTLKTNGERHTVLFPNWVDLDQIYPLIGQNPMRNELGIAADKVVLLYSGNMGQKQGLETIIDAARILADQPKYQFVMCGDGLAKERLHTMASDLSNILWLPLQPTERLNELLNMADIHLLPQSADVADLVMPSKLTGMLASGRPVIATASPDTQVAKTVAQAGLVVPTGDVKAFITAIIQLGEDPELRQELGSAGRQWIQLNCEKESILWAFKTELEKLAGYMGLHV